MKFLCAFIIGIQEDRVFQVSKRIIGRGGANTKYISELCPGTKIRLRGKVSGFKEPTTNQESNIPLQVNLSSPSKEEYSTAKQEMAHLLNAIYATYKNVTGRDVRLRLNEHPRNPKWINTTPYLFLDRSKMCVGWSKNSHSRTTKIILFPILTRVIFFSFVRIHLNFFTLLGLYDYRRMTKSNRNHIYWEINTGARFFILVAWYCLCVFPTPPHFEFTILNE